MNAQMYAVSFLHVTLKSLACSEQTYRRKQKPDKKGFKYMVLEQGILKSCANCVANAAFSYSEVQMMNLATCNSSYFHTWSTDLMPTAPHLVLLLSSHHCP